MRRIRKTFLGIGIAVGVVIAALVIALGWLVYTPSGLRFALDRGVAMMDGRFAYAGASGSLAGETTITGLRYRTEGGDTVHIKHASLDLQLSALLRGRLHIEKARINGVVLDLATSAPPQKSEASSLQPPLTVVIDDMRLTQIAVNKGNKTVFAAKSLAIAGLWSDQQLRIRQLELRAPAGSASLEGTLALAAGHRGHATARIDWARDGTHYVGSIRSQSDGHKATLQAHFTAPVQAKLTASLDLDPRHAWTFNLVAPKFDATALPALPSAVQTLALDLHGAGHAYAGKLTGTVAINGHTIAIDPAQFRYAGKTLTLDPLRLRSPSMPGVVSASGVVQLSATPISAKLDARWQGVQLPADLVGQVLATHGEAHLTGTTQRFTLKGALALGPPGKLSNIKVDLAGTPQQIELHSLKLVQEHGGLDAHGSIGLQPRVSWQLTAIAHRFNPGALLAGWNGALDFSLTTQGNLTGQGPVATLKLDHTGGTLRQHNIAGTKADIRVTPHNFFAGSMTLVAGHSRIHAVGKPGDHTDATIDLDIVSLADWLPDAAGKLQGRFTAKGRWPKLAVAGQLHGNDLSMGPRQVGKLDLSLSVPDASQPGGKLDLVLHGVHASGLEFKTVRLSGSGTAASQHLTLRAQGQPLSTSLALQGAWQDKTRRWTGTLSGLELAIKGMPSWRQQQPTAITWDQGAAKVSQLCLVADGPRLCLSGARDAHGRITAKYELQSLPLQMLTALASHLPRLQASGSIAGSGQFSLSADGKLDGHASLAASAGQIAFASDAKQPLLAWTGITLDATAKGTTQHLVLRGAFADGGHLNGDVTVSGAKQALSGSLDVNLRDLSPLDALSTQIANVKGALNGNLKLGGSLSAPQFTGRIQTAGLGAELPRLGLKLHDGQFAIVGNQAGRLTIEGQIASGKGVLHVKGNTGLSADAPLNVDLEGKNVLVADIPAAHVVASPDLKIARADGLFTLTGSVTIPSAMLKVEQLPGQGPTQASSDVVIVDAPPAKKSAPIALKADIEVKLGDDVKVQGYGLDGRVQGQLAVQVRPGQPATGRGQISVTGTYKAYGQDLTIQRGRILFAGTRLDDPALDIRAVREFPHQDITVGLAINGTALRPVLTVFSDPAMEQAEALSYLVTGKPLSTLQSGEGNTLNTAAQALGGLAGDRIAKSIGARVGVQAGVSNSQALGGSAFTAGKYLSPRLFLSYGVGLFTPGQVVTLRYTISRHLNFEAQNATTGNRASLNYKIEK